MSTRIPGASNPRVASSPRVRTGFSDAICIAAESRDSVAVDGERGVFFEPERSDDMCAAEDEAHAVVRDDAAILFSSCRFAAGSP